MNIKFIITILMVFLLSGCGIAHEKTNIKIETSSYSERTVDIKGKYNFDLSCDVANIQMYSWKKDDIKFEITKRISGTYEKEVLNEKLKNFEIDIKTDNDTVFLKSRYKGDKDFCSMVVDYTIYIPKSIEFMNYKVNEGNIKLFDDVHGTLNAELDNSDIEINRFDGILNICGNKGDVKISSGKISGKSEVKKSVGNISIKTEFDENGVCDIYTGLGHIDLSTYTHSKVEFETVGELAINEFAQNDCSEVIADGRSDDKGAKVRLKSELGKISIREYK